MKYAEMKIGRMVADDYRCATVFRKYGIDFCCGGGRKLQEVCDEEGHSITDVTTELEALINDESTPINDFDNLSLSELSDYIIEKHHTYVKEAIPPLEEFTSKVARVHGDRLPEVIEISNYFMTMANELISHMMKEENILFPAIKQVQEHADKGLGKPASPFGSVANPIGVLEMEHDATGDAMKMIRELTNDFTPPAGACMTHRVSYHKLEEFETMLHEHVHLENNILFPSAIALEEKLPMISNN